jgi:glycosyltransferase involved in cell wall biosynthesis
MNYSSIFLPHIGGIEQNIYYFAMNSKHNHVVLTDPLYSTSLYERMEKINVYRVPPRRRHGSTTLCKVANALIDPIRDLNKARYLHQLQYDILHIRAPYLSPDLFFVLDHWLGGTFFKRIAAWRLSKKPLVVTFHMLPSHGTISKTIMPIPYPQSYRERKSWVGIEKIICDEADAIICVDKFMVNEIEQMCKSARSRTYYVPSAIDNVMFRPMEKFEANEALPPRIKKLIPDGSFLVLYLGRLDYVKGSQFLVQLAEKFPKNMKLIVVGEGYLYLQTSENMICLGPLENSLVPFLINACDVVFNPVMVKGTSRVTFEAMACGKPVVMFGEDEDRYPLVDKENGFLVKDLDEATNILSNLMNSSELCQRIGRQAIYTSKKYSIRKLAQYMDGIYDKVGTA